MNACRILAGLCCVLVPLWAGAQPRVEVSVPGVRVQAGEGSTAANVAGDLGPDVEMEGVAVINGQVYVDGEKVPRGRTTYRSGKTGKTYRIHWGSNGNVAVEEK